MLGSLRVYIPFPPLLFKVFEVTFAEAPLEIENKD
jgi:hypothetical protein